MKKSYLILFAISVIIMGAFLFFFIKENYYNSEMTGGMYPLLLELQTNDHKQTPAFQLSYTKLTHRLPFEEARTVYEAIAGYAPSLYLTEKLTKEVGIKIEELQLKYFILHRRSRNNQENTQTSRFVGF